MKSLHSLPEEPPQTRAPAVLFRPLLPRDVVVVEGRITDAQGPLFNVEASAIRFATEKRQREYGAGRFMAHAALLMLVGKPHPVGTAADHSPQWPAGVVGSITHTDTMAAVAVARAATWASVGIDLEETARVDASLAHVICTPRERKLGLPLALVFSAKEALYKCQYPLTQQWMDYGDAEIAISHDTSSRGRFTATLMQARGRFAQGHRFEGRWSEVSGTVATAICCAQQADTPVR